VLAQACGRSDAAAGPLFQTLATLSCSTRASLLARWRRSWSLRATISRASSKRYAAFSLIDSRRWRGLMPGLIPAGSNSRAGQGVVVDPVGQYGTNRAVPCVTTLLGARTMVSAGPPK
jgi:hypothetical protein